MTARTGYRGFDVSSLTVERSSGAVDGSHVSGLDRLDFPTVAELCRCCGIELLPSGCRWDIWFCATCKARVMAFNRSFGAWVIPIGRYTLMHGQRLLPRGAARRGSDARFDASTHSLFLRMDRLAVWGAEVVRRNCAAAGLATCDRVPIYVYLESVATLSRNLAFAMMCKWWLGGDEQRSAIDPEK